MDLTATGGGLYRVTVDGVEVSRHTAEREAVERAVSEKRAQPAAEVAYDHSAYVVRVEVAERRSGRERRQGDSVSLNRRNRQRRGAVPAEPATPPVWYVTITSAVPPSMGPGDTHQAVALVESQERLDPFTGPTRLDLTATYPPVWSSSDAGVFSVHASTGVVTYVGAGSAVIRATSGGVTASATYTGVSPVAAVASVTIAPASAALAPGGTTILTAVVRDASANVLVGRTVTWNSATPAAATVGADSGNDNHTVTVTAVADGSSNVKATCETVDSNLVPVTVTSLATYRGANLPAGITAPATLSDPFGGATWDISTLIVNSARYTAATTLTVSSTGSAGRTELLAHLATHAAGSVDHKIILPTGTLSGGIYTLPAKADVSKHCYLVTEDIHDGTFGTARGTKIPASTTGMTILEGPASSQNSIVVCASSGSARGYSFHGCVIQNNQTSAAYDVALGIVEVRQTGARNTLADYPGRLYFDRYWIRGSPTTDIRRGIYANGPYLHAEDSRITEIHWVGNECAGVGGFDGSQFHNWINLTIEAGTQFILYGGADPARPQTNTLDTADIFTDKVYGYRPLTWMLTDPSYGGIKWACKTGFEGKNVRRWVIDRSITKNNWADAQNGYAMLFQNLSDNNTNHLENRVEDVVVRHHKFDFIANGLNLLSRVAYNGGIDPVNKMNRMVFDNILMIKCGGNQLGTNQDMIVSTPGYLGRAQQFLKDIQNLTVDRWTADGSRGGQGSGTGGVNWTITNHVQRLGQYGYFFDGARLGYTGFNYQAPTGLTVNGNVGYGLSDANQSNFTPYWDANETSASMLFQDYAGHDYRLTSAHLTSGVGGGVPGCDINTLNTMLTGVAD